MNEEPIEISKHDRHFFLYAKNHYETEDLIEDLKKILSHRSMLSCEHIQTKDIIQILTRIAAEVMIRTDFSDFPDDNITKLTNDFCGFIFDLHPTNSWKIGVENKYDDEGGIIFDDADNFEEALILKSLSILRFAVVTKEALGKIDTNILPVPGFFNLPPMARIK